MPYRPTPCKCAGYASPRIDPRIHVGPPPHPKVPSDDLFHRLVDELQERIEDKDNLHGTTLGYAKAGEPIPLPPQDDDEDPYQPLVLENLQFGYGEGEGEAEEPREAKEREEKPELMKFPRVGELGTKPYEVLKSRLTGSPGNTRVVHLDSASPWTNADGRMVERVAVWWALQKDGNVRYNADSRKLFVSFTDGTQKDVASVAEAIAVVQQNGGANPNNGRGFNAVGAFIADRVKKAAG